MKQLFAILVSACIFFSCQKKRGGIDTISADWPHASIFTIDNGTDWVYLRIGSNVILRDQVDKNYSMADLAREKDCHFEVRLGALINAKQSYSFHLTSDRSTRMRVRKTASVYGTEELYLGIHESDTAPSDDSWRFFIHFESSVDGKKRVRIESVQYPGYFLTSAGHTLNAKGVQLKTENDQRAAIFVLHR